MMRLSGAYKGKAATMLQTLLLSAVLLSCSQVAANDNIIAHDLYLEARYAEAAEIFTDPAWKGIAMYRSGQWWRAAEAFVRANDATSIYNLGNSYIKLGYYELALDAFLAALELDPTHADAQHNAEVTRQLLQLGDDREGQAALQPQSREIDTVEADQAEETAASNTEAGDGDQQEREQGTDREGDTSRDEPAPEATAKGNSNEAGSDETLDNSEDSPGGSVQGRAGQDTPDQRPASGAESDDESADSQSAGIRNNLEATQATEQWLNQIQHNPERFLRARIRLEQQRRIAAGVTAPAGGSAW